MHCSLWQEKTYFGVLNFIMNFSQFLNTIRARRTLLLSALLATVAFTLVISLLLPTTYQASATLVLNYKGIDPLNGIVIPAQLMHGYMATQAGVIASKSVAIKVVEELGLADDARARRDFDKATGGKGDIKDWLAGRLLKKVSVDAARDSSVISVSVKAADPRLAATLANAFAAKYQEATIELRSSPMKKLSSYLNDQSGKLREELQAALNKRANFLQEHGIVNVDERIDVETTRLSELSRQVVAAQAQLAEASSRSRQAQGAGRDDAPDVAASPLIQNLKAALAQAEANFAKTAVLFQPEHPTYQAAQAEVAKARSALQANIRSTSASIGESARIAAQRESELRAGLEAQKTKVLELNRMRAELALLDKEVDRVQKAYDAAANRYQQTSVEAYSNQADVAVLNSATPPTAPAGPHVLLNTLLSIALGTVLGIGAALVAELLDRRVRSISDLELLRVPVLGTVKWTPAQREFPLVALAQQRLPG